MMIDQFQSAYRGLEKNGPFLVASLNPSTWLALITFLYHCTIVLSGAHVPTALNAVAIVAFTFLLSRLYEGVAVTFLGARNPYLPEKYMGKFRGVACDNEGNPPEKNGGNDVVVFIVGAQFNHPFGAFAPNVKLVGDKFNQLLQELEDDPEKWGFLGKSDTMMSQAPGRGASVVTLTYWRSLEDLHRYNLGTNHSWLRQWWNANLEKMPHLAIFHETYSVPAFKWESIYENLHPFGLGQTRMINNPDELDSYTSALLPAKGTSMHTRMSRSLATGFK